MFQKNNLTIDLNVLYTKEMKICPPYFSKINSNCAKQIILLMIPNEEKKGWHYLAVTKLSALLKTITSKYSDDFYCLNCLHSFTTENKLKCNEKVCKDFCRTVIPSERDNILIFNQNMKSDKILYIIYADLKFFAMCQTMIIIKNLETEFGENKEKYKNFSIPIEKEDKKIDKDGNESVVTISYKIRFINTERLFVSSRSKSCR